MSAPDTAAPEFSEAALAKLEASGIPVEAARSFGVRMVWTADGLPREFRGNRKATTPALIIPIGDPLDDDRQTCHLRPDHPALDEKGRPAKYVHPSKKTGQYQGLGRVSGPRTDATRRGMVIEGSFGSLAGAFAAPDDTLVLATFGVLGWRANVAGLRALAGLPVVVVVDGDAAVNPRVYDAANDLGAALLAAGATSVRFVRLPGAATKDGLDDHLARADDPAAELAALRAEAQPTPADERPDVVPTPLVPPRTPAPFPIDALPPVLADYARELARYTQTPVDMTGMGALGVISAAVQGRLDVAAEWTEIALLWVLLVAPPGARKSPAHEAAHRAAAARRERTAR